MNKFRFSSFLREKNKKKIFKLDILEYFIAEYE